MFTRYDYLVHANHLSSALEPLVGAVLGSPKANTALADVKNGDPVQQKDVTDDPESCVHAHNESLVPTTRVYAQTDVRNGSFGM